MFIGIELMNVDPSQFQEFLRYLTVKLILPRYLSKIDTTCKLIKWPHGTCTYIYQIFNLHITPSFSATIQPEKSGTSDDDVPTFHTGWYFSSRIWRVGDTLWDLWAPGKPQ